MNWNSRKRNIKWILSPNEFWYDIRSISSWTLFESLWREKSFDPHLMKNWHSSKKSSKFWIKSYFRGWKGIYSLEMMDWNFLMLNSDSGKLVEIFGVITNSGFLNNGVNLKSFWNQGDFIPECNEKYQHNGRMSILQLTFFQKVISWRSDRIQGLRFLNDFFMILRKYKSIRKYFSLLFVFFLRIWWRILGERFWSFEKISCHFDL